MKKKRSTGNHVSRQYYFRHLLPVVVWALWPPGGRPDEDAPCWSVDLAAGAAEPMSH